MRIKKSDHESMEVAVEDLFYVPDAESDEKDSLTGSTDNVGSNFDEISYNLYNIRLDHDYTPHCRYVEDDELARTLSILDGDEESVSPPLKPVKTTEQVAKSKVKVSTTPLKPTPKDQQKKLKSKQKEEEEESIPDKETEKKKIPKPDKPKEIKSPKPVKPPEPESPKPEKSQPVDKKQPKKEKKPTKPVPDDFALFSTPDIIRRVPGGKEPTSPELPSPDGAKPAKIETRSKSVSETSLQASTKQTRLSLDSKTVTPPKIKDKKASEGKVRRDSGSKSGVELSKTTSESSSSISVISDNLESIMTSSDDKSFSGLPMDTHDLSGSDQNMTLDGNGLDLDPSLLENINNDLISEDILYQVAQSLVSNTELQNAIDKSLNEENLGLESVEEMQQDNEAQNQTEQVNFGYFLVR